MPKQKIAGLLSNLHEKMGDTAPSAQQELLLAQMESELSSWEGALPANGDIKQTAELLLNEFEDSHPKAMHVMKEIVEVLANIRL